MFDYLFGDKSIYELIRKVGWKDPTLSSDDEPGIDTTELHLISGGVVAVMAGALLFQHSKK